MGSSLAVITRMTQRGAAYYTAAWQVQFRQPCSAQVPHDSTTRA
jgi:hypothetical protein